MSSVTSLTTLLGIIAVPGLGLALVTASARRYLRSVEPQPPHPATYRSNRIYRARSA